SNVQDLKDYFHKVYRPNLNKHTPLTIAFRNLIKDIWSEEYTNYPPNPTAMQDYMSRLSSRFGNSRPQDSHEFMITLINAIHEELKTDEGHSKIQELFHGEIQSTVTCSQCKIPFYSHDLITSLALQVPEEQYSSSCNQSSSSVTLRDCIQTLTKRQTYSNEDQWYCNNVDCERSTDADRKLDIWKLPKVLIIQLQRFRSDLRTDRKIETFINYPRNNLDLNEFVEGPEKNKGITYELIGVSNHSGSIFSGHYTTYARNDVNGKWYKFDDSTVEEIDEDKVISQMAYILIYQQKQDCISVIDNVVRLNVYHKTATEPNAKIIKMPINGTFELLKTNIIAAFSLPFTVVSTLWKWEPSSGWTKLIYDSKNETLLQHGLTDDFQIGYEVSTQTSTKQILGLRGLRNIGNTCYINSAIQCLSNVQDLKDYFHKVYRPNLNKHTPLTIAFRNLIKDIWSEEYTN
ncbi:unnamed protein product, partial [Rotaria sp. Silwood2]